MIFGLGIRWTHCESDQIWHQKKASDVPSLARTAEWAAGLFEGEGYFYSAQVNQGGRRYSYAAAGLQMTDEGEVRDFHEIVGVGAVHGPYHAPNRKPTWKWYTSDARPVIRLLEPWLGQRRLVQAINALAADTREI